MKQKHKILIVDDVIVYLNSLKRAIGDEFETVTAASFDEAKQKMSDDVNLLLIDICLDESQPGLDKTGVEILKWAKEKFADKPVVMMSSYRDFDAVTECLNLGAEKFLKKPINIVELKAMLRAIAIE